MKLICFRLLTSDYTASVSFWRDIMGLTPKYSDESIRYAYFETDSAGIELMGRDDFATALGEATPAPMPAGHQGVINFCVDDVELAFADLTKRGATLIKEPHNQSAWQVRVAHIATPDNYIVEIYQKL